MSRTSNSKSVKEIISDYLQGKAVRGSKGPTVFIHREVAEAWANEIAEILPHSSGAKAWVGYGLDRSTVLYNGSSKNEVKGKWQADILAEPEEVKTVYSGSGIYRYSFTAPDLSSHDVWIVQAGSEGFGN